ncbi:flagellar biosynthesis protein FlhF [Tumebacillus permanentifrigoris]|uniref:Flagellar biosynthesis protein FlhF n=1 Tax=Tumebacillus permanentifrigoris TaxID=378543 RepID=A0A316D9B6_9BACL|nr:flagellar biosynthesis protein FlhF [Tumebacillus permanentifrigoris]PWK12694.1 flagellar biosynthesis protein FlhF [Tumebacillus permanentifrigoris]
MLVKRYLVKEMPEAVAMIREDLGKDAVILSTKKIQSRGFLGLFSKTHIEVVAAANEEKPPERPPVSPSSMPRNFAMGAYQQHQVRPTAAGATATLEPERAMAFQPEAAPPVAPVAAVSATPVEPVLEPPQVFTEPLLAPRAKEDDTQVLKEVQDLRHLIRSLIHTTDNKVLPEAVVRVRKELLANQVDEELVDDLVERGIREFQQVQDITEQEFRGILTKFISEELEKVGVPSSIAPTTRVASFMGPTGVGKTTTIAKLAAEQVLSHGKRVGLITTDTYRIAAVEQLRTYATILNLPLEVCYSPEDVQRSMEKFAEFDLILVDTAGRNYHNQLNVRELKPFLQALTPDETFLVLALTSKASDLTDIVKNFEQVPIQKFLFTKADETTSYGAIYNLVVRRNIPLSYLTTGQTVPDDIEIVSAQKVASLVVGEKSDA